MKSKSKENMAATIAAAIKAKEARLRADLAAAQRSLALLEGIESPRAHRAVKQTSMLVDHLEHSLSSLSLLKPTDRIRRALAEIVSDAAAKRRDPRSPAGKSQP